MSNAIKPSYTWLARNYASVAHLHRLRLHQGRKQTTHLPECGTKHQGPLEHATGNTRCPKCLIHEDGLRELVTNATKAKS